MSEHSKLNPYKFARYGRPPLPSMLRRIARTKVSYSRTEFADVFEAARVRDGAKDVASWIRKVTLENARRK